MDLLLAQHVGDSSRQGFLERIRVFVFGRIFTLLRCFQQRVIAAHLA